jgi:hypothetical protein
MRLFFPKKMSWKKIHEEEKKRQWKVKTCPRTFKGYTAYVNTKSITELFYYT